MQNKRIEWIDISKGVAILLVMLGHTHCAPFIGTWIYSFHIPLFFFLSGLTFSPFKYSAREYIINKVYRLLIPAISFSVIIFAYNVIVGKADLTLRRIIICIASEVLQLRGGVRMSGPWFLISLFVVEIALYFLFNKLNEKTVGIICVICALIGTIYMTFMSVYLPWSIDASLISIAYVYLGYRLKSWLKNISDKSELAIFKYCGIAVLLLVVNLICCFMNYCGINAHVDLYATTLGNPILYWGESLSGTISIVLFLILFSSIAPCKIMKILTCCGKRSIFLYMAHGILFDVMDRILSAAGVDFAAFTPLQLSVLGLIYVCIGFLTFALLYRPVLAKIPFLVGIRKIR